MIVIHVSLEDQPLAMLNRNAGYTRLNICLRGYDKIISPEPLRGNRGNGLETSAKRSSIELKGEEVGNFIPRTTSKSKDLIVDFKIADLLPALKGEGSPCPFVGGSLVPPIYSGLHLSFGGQ
jgi:hypothetical protein